MEEKCHQANLNSLSVLKQLKQTEEDFTKKTEDMQNLVRNSVEDANIRIKSEKDNMDKKIAEYEAYILEMKSRF